MYDGLDDGGIKGWYLRRTYIMYEGDYHHLEEGL